MSVKSALIGSAIGLSVSGLGCSAILSIVKKFNKDKHNDEGEVMTISRQLTPILVEQISNVVVVASGLFGLYYGMKNDIKLLRN
tara:strand:- start:352 stop:603 length:252 start_codon:yes stop_codon:yes gene_type:complete